MAPLRGTGAHPLYSLDRADWVRVRDLRIGERLQTAEGAVSVEALEKVRGLHRVYNLEVEGDHEYLVGEAGVRAHNTCSWGSTFSTHAKFRAALLERARSTGNQQVRWLGASNKAGQNKLKELLNSIGRESLPDLVRNAGLKGNQAVDVAIPNHLRKTIGEVLTPAGEILTPSHICFVFRPRGKDVVEAFLVIP